MGAAWMRGHSATALAHQQDVGIVLPGASHRIVWDLCRLATAEAGRTDLSRACNSVQGATATLAFTATVAL
jgi:hypothetical protein